MHGILTTRVVDLEINFKNVWVTIIAWQAVLRSNTN